MNKRILSIVILVVLSVWCNFIISESCLAGDLGVWDGVMSDDPAEEHLYAFTVEQDGAVTLEITVADTMVSQYAAISILDANGDSFGTTYIMENPKTVVYHLAPGEFTAKISKHRGDIYGEYSIDAEFSPAGPNISESENNDDLSTANLIDNDIIYGAIGYQRLKDSHDKSDYFQIDLPADGVLTLNVTSDASLYSSQYTYLGIYDAANNQLDYGFISAASKTVTFRMVKGSYYLRMNLTLLNYYGAYTIEINHTAAINNSSESEVNDSSGQADIVTSLTINGAIGYNRAEIPDEREIDVEDWFQFESDGGDMVFNVVAPDSLTGFYTTFSVKDAAGDTLDYMWLTGNEKTLSVNDMDAGTYYISLYVSQWGKYWGGYTIGINTTGILFINTATSSSTFADLIIDSNADTTEWYRLWTGSYDGSSYTGDYVDTSAFNDYGNGWISKENLANLNPDYAQANDTQLWVQTWDSANGQSEWMGGGDPDFNAIDSVSVTKEVTGTTQLSDMFSDSNVESGTWYQIWISQSDGTSGTYADFSSTLDYGLDGDGVPWAAQGWVQDSDLDQADYDPAMYSGDTIWIRTYTPTAGYTGWEGWTVSD